jgi:hypothetical protein
MIIISEANVNAASEEILAVDKIDIDDDILVESNVSTVSEVDSDAQDLSLLGLEKEKPVNDLVGMDHRDQDSIAAAVDAPKIKFLLSPHAAVFVPSFSTPSKSVIASVE